ncbi:MAG TPA: Nramp family divalent metal transporter [Ramlibacter sp.]|nr:Nramp family divalent metal transporter [Ramlibacter sp.]
MNVMELFLGIMTALGGFVDIGELVFAISAGARFGYMLLWAVLLGTVGIFLFSEMSGRMAAVLKKPTFEIVRDRYGYNRGLLILVASNLVNVLTCAAEIGGAAIILQILVPQDLRVMLLVAAGFLLVSTYVLKFKWIERVYGVCGLTLLVFAAAAWALEPGWGDVARGFVPHLPEAGMPGLPLYAYFAVGLFSSILMPYEIYFYSSGGIEDQWKPKDLLLNKVTAGVGFVLGGLLVCALIIVGAALFMPGGVVPQRLSSTIFGASIPLGAWGFRFALAGIFFAIAGAAVETALAAGYNIAQFFGFAWGKRKNPGEVPLFTLCWMGALVIGLAVSLTGVNPLDIVEYSVIFAILVLPFTYYAVLRLADDKEVMGKHVNSPVARVAGWIYLVLITLAAIAAVPLMIATHMGQG